jgi:arylsulfatase A-like enzyme
MAVSVYALYQSRSEDFLLKKNHASLYFTIMTLIICVSASAVFFPFYQGINLFLKKLFRKIPYSEKIPLTWMLLSIIVLVIAISGIYILVKFQQKETYRNIIKFPVFAGLFIAMHGILMLIFHILNVSVFQKIRMKYILASMIILFPLSVYLYSSLPCAREMLQRKTVYANFISGFFSPILNSDLFTEEQPAYQIPEENALSKENNFGKIPEEVSDGSKRTASPDINSGISNVMMIIVDSLRWDHTGYFGYDRETTPAIDSFAGQSIVFKKAYAQANNTPRSFPSIFTSRFPSRIMWSDVYIDFSPVRPENLTIAELLKIHGFKTIAVLSHWYFSERRRMDQGFQVWDNEAEQAIIDENEKISSPSVYNRASYHLEKLKESGEKFFMVTHFMDPHSEYMRHKEVKQFGSEIADLYDNEILFTDTYIGKLLQKIQKLGFMENTAIFIFSDHGEAFNEHNHYFHGYTLYEEEIRIPVFLRLPEALNMEIEEKIALVDIFPTILSLLNIPVPENIDGVNLLDVINGKKRGIPIYSELLPYKNHDIDCAALIIGNIKIMHSKNLKLWEIYDLSADPLEKHNLVYDMPDAEKYKEELLLWQKNPFMAKKTYIQLMDKKNNDPFQNTHL